MAQDNEWIIEMLLESTSITPSELLEEVMADSRCSTFGPVHHFIVGAVLLACWHNAEAASDRNACLTANLYELANRSNLVPGATCARWGVCGAAASAGMAYAIVRGNAPLRDEGWQEGQLMVAKLLEKIALSGTPRCCKRDARVAVSCAVEYFNTLGEPRLSELRKIPVCNFSKDNAVCTGAECSYHS